MNLVLFPIGIAVILTGVVAASSWVYSLKSGNDVSERLETYALVPELGQRREKRQIRSRMVRLRLRVNSMLSAFTSEELGLNLASANWPITETEYILIRIWSTVSGFVMAWILFRSI